jgi:hypothetical protein
LGPGVANARENGAENANTTAPELAKDAKERLKALEALSEKAEGGGKSARRELRKAVRESAPGIISRTSDIDRRGRWALIKTIAANDPLTEEMVEAVGEVAEEVLRENGKEEEAAENLRGKATLLWGNVRGLVSLTTIDRLLDGQEEAERLVEQAVRVHLSSWRGG